jgi:hypothetical protein
VDLTIGSALDIFGTFFSCTHLPLCFALGVCSSCSSIYTYTLTCVYACLHLCVYEYMHACMHACVCPDVCEPCVCSRVCNTHTHTHTHTHLHTHTHTYTLIKYNIFFLYTGGNLSFDAVVQWQRQQEVPSSLCSQKRKMN